MSIDDGPFLALFVMGLLVFAWAWGRSRLLWKLRRHGIEVTGHVASV